MIVLLDCLVSIFTVNNVLIDPHLNVKQKVLHSGFGSSLLKLCANCVVGFVPVSFAVESMTDGNVRLARDSYLVANGSVPKDEMGDYYKDYYDAVVEKKPFLRDEHRVFKDKYYP